LILESVTLDNIRSYVEPTTIQLPTGSTLFEGDIGSGKSSILSAIEFALFGLGDVDGRYLLNSKAMRGSVLLEFRVGEKKYVVYRELIRNKKSVIQGEGYIVEGDTKTGYAVTGMRGRILDIIGIKERPQAKTTSMIYRSAIFSPQEMMKEILTEDSDRRLDTLRRAFGIEEYSNAKRNSELIDRWAAVQAKVSAAGSNGLAQKRQALTKEEENRSRISTENDRISSEFKIIQSDIQQADQKLAGLKEHRDMILQLEASIPLLQNRVGDAKSALTEERRRLSGMKDELAGIERAEKQVGELGQRYAEYNQEKQELESLEPISEEFAKNENERQRLKAALGEKVQRLQSEISSLKEEVALEETELQNDMKRIEPIGKLGARRAELVRSVAELARVKKKSEELKATAERLKLEKLPLQDEIKTSKVELDGIMKIGAGAPCPKCKQALSEEHIHQLKKEYTTAAAIKRKKIAGVQTRLAKALLERKSVEAKLDSLVRDENELRDLEPRLSVLNEKADAAKKAESKMAAKKGRLEAMIETLRTKDFALEERKAQDSVERVLQEQAPAASRYKELKKRVQAAEREQVQSTFLQAAEKVRRKPQLEEEVKSSEMRIASSEESIVKQEHDVEDRKTQYAREKPALKELSALEKERERLNSDSEDKTKKLVTLTANLDNVRERIGAISEDIMRMEDADRRKVYFEQFRGWLDSCFVPAVEDIERSRLKMVNEQFNQEFQKWFRVLIETEDIDVTVDESFTPIVTQGGYSLDVNSLSGGERTSVALAYRLALNVTSRAAVGLEPDLLILDEPTDGFSSVQLTKLNQVLDGLRTAQVIMVSHERELETYVNHICRVTKEGGVSRVQFVRQ
jgi:exonuclease SbcC